MARSAAEHRDARGGLSVKGGSQGGRPCLVKGGSQEGRPCLVKGGARGGRPGFALVELLTATLIGGLALGAAIALLQAHGAIARRSQAAIETAGAAGWAQSITARDLELAGADPMRVGIAALLHGASDRVVLQMDRNGDGAIDEASAERVTLSWGPSPGGGGRLVRSLGGQSMAIADGIPPGGLRFRYFDAEGSELVPRGTASLGARELEAVCHIALELTFVARFAGREERFHIVSGAALRSRMPGGT